MAELDPIDEIAVFGKIVEDFLQSEIGDYLVQRAKADEAEATEWIVTHVFGGKDEARLEAVGKLYAARSFSKWLGDAVYQGQQAIALKQEEEHG